MYLLMDQQDHQLIGISFMVLMKRKKEKSKKNMVRIYPRKKGRVGNCKVV